MNKYLRILLLVSILSLTPFTYLYMRDFVYADEEEVNISDCTPYNLETEEERFKVTIRWKTNDRCPGFIKYDISSKNSEGKTVPSTDGFLPATEHTVVVEDLKPETTYYMWIYSDDKAYGEGGVPYPVRL